MARCRHREHGRCTGGDGYGTGRNRVAGTLIGVPVADNQAVKTGDVIALIDTADFVAKER